MPAAPTVQGPTPKPGRWVAARLASAAAPVVLTAAMVAWPAPGRAQEDGALQTPEASEAPTAIEALGGGSNPNLALSLVEAGSPFFRAEPQSLGQLDPGAFVRRASVAGEGDGFLVVAVVSDEDVLDRRARLIDGIERLPEVDGIMTWWGEVLKQTQPLASEDPPTVGLILAVFDGDPLVRQESVADAIDGLVASDDVFLVARTRGGADLLAMYDVDGADLASGVATAESIHDVLSDNEIEIEVEAVAMPLSDRGT